jgi:hypothetical protein
MRAGLETVEAARLECGASSCYSETVKNITVSLDDEAYRRARMKAAELGVSVSALVRRYLTELGSSESEFEQLKREERSLRDQITAFSAGNRLIRDAIHERSRR